MAAGGGRRPRGARALLSFGAIVASALSWAAPGAGAGTSTDPIVPSGFHVAGLSPSPSNPVRVWILGDSVMNDASPAIAAALAATGEATVVADSSFGGWGLTTQPAWIPQSQQILADYQPQVIIGTWSWDDTLAGDDPKLYASLLAQAIRVWTEPGDGVQLVVLLQFPPVGPNPYLFSASLRARSWLEVTQEQDAWDRIAESMVSVFPGHVAYLTTAQLFAPGGRFLTWTETPSGSLVRIRQLDNVHLCPFGAAELGQLVVSDLHSMLGLDPPAPGWVFGPWAADPRYNFGIGGPGACPEDRPLPGYDGVLLPKPGPELG
jgi:hypothetical protein